MYFTKKLAGPLGAAFISLLFATPTLAAPPEARVLERAPDGKFWSVVVEVSTTPTAGIRVERRDPTGDLLSSSPLAGAVDEGRFDLEFDDSGKVWVVGARSSGGAPELGIWSFSSADGSLISNDSVPGALGGVFAGGIVIDDGGDLWIAGGEENPDETIRLVLWRFDAAGAARAGFPVYYSRDAGADAATDLVVDPSGNAFVVGVSANPATSEIDLAIWKFASTGVLTGGFPKFWPAIRPAGATLDDSIGGGIVAAGLDELWVATSKTADSCSTPDLALVRFNAAGDVTASSSWRTEGGEAALGNTVRIDSLGNLTVVGTAAGAPSFWRFGSEGSLASGFPRTGAEPFDAKALFLDELDAPWVGVGSVPTKFLAGDFLLGTDAARVCGAAGTATIAGTLTFPAGFLGGETVFVLATDDFYALPLPIAEFTASPGTTLAYSLTVPAPGSYFIAADVDSGAVGAYSNFSQVAARSGETVGGIDFSLSDDAAPPASAITSFADGATVSSLSPLSGTAADNTAVESLRLAAHDLDFNLWWHGETRTWISTTATPLLQGASPEFLGRPSAPAWQADIGGNATSAFGPLSLHLATGHRYRLYSSASDVSDNAETPPTQREFIWGGPQGDLKPALPLNLQGEALGISSTSWSWDAVPGAIHYLIQSVSEPGTKIVVAATTFTQVDLATNTAPGFCLQSVNNFEEGDVACGLATYTFAAIPGSLEGVASSSHSLAWDWDRRGNSNTVTAYEFALSTDGFASNSVVLPFSTDLESGTTDIFNLAAETTYYARVKARNGNGIETDYSLVVTTWTLPPDRVPPVLQTHSPAAGQLIQRPGIASALWTDNFEVARTSFSVDGVVIGTSAGSSMSVDWETRALSDGDHTLLFWASDTSGNEAVSTAIVTTRYRGPSAPTIFTPIGGFITKVATISMSGIGETGTTVQVLVNNLDLASIAVDELGEWEFPELTLFEEGDVVLSALAFEDRGFSPPSVPVSGVFASTAPNAPLLTTADSGPGGQALLTWDAPAGKTPRNYRVYRSTEEADLEFVNDAPPASLRIAQKIGVLHYEDLTPNDDLWFYAVGAYDGVFESRLSNSLPVFTDRVKPVAELSFNRSSPFGPGEILVDLTMSELLIGTPLLTFNPDPDATKQQPIGLVLESVSPFLFRTTVTITEAMPSGIALFSFQGADLANNVGTVISSGSTTVLDTQGPIGTVFLAKSSPLNGGPLAVSLVLDEAPVEDPILTVTPEGGEAILIPLVSTNSLHWTAIFIITIETGDGEAILSYTATDVLGNRSDTLTGGTTVFVIDTVAPGAPPSFGIRANPGPGGVVNLSWSAPSGDRPFLYRVYHDGIQIAEVSPNPQDGTGAYTDLPEEGPHGYEISSLDRAGNESALTDPPVTTDATAPSAPINLTAELNEFGSITLVWESGDPGQTASFLLYTSLAPIPTTLEGAIARSAALPFTDTPQQDGTFRYRVTALDTVGNESPPSNEVEIFFDKAAPKITISGAEQGEFLSADFALSYQAFDANLKVGSVVGFLDGAPFVSGDTVSDEGLHLLFVQAGDTGGHISESTRTFTLDKTPPLITYSGADEGGTLFSTVTIGILVSDLNPNTSAFLLVNQSLKTEGAYSPGSPITRDGFYVVSATATDQAGNAATASLSFRLDVAPAAPGNLTLIVENGAKLAWTRPEPDVVGYRVYRDGQRISFGTSQTLSFFDPAFDLGPETRYEVSAVDGRGIEGARVGLIVPAVSVTLRPQTLTRGYFDAVTLEVENKGSQSLSVGPAEIEILNANSIVAEGTASATNAGPGSIAALTAVVSSPPDLPSAPTVRARLTLPEGITVVRSFASTAAEPKEPFLEVFPDTLVPGTESEVRVRFYNRGSASIDIITAEILNSTISAVNEVRLALKTPEGTLFAQGGLAQGGPKTIAAFVGTRQVFFVRVPPKSSALFDPVRVLVPNTSLSNLLVEAVLSTPTHNLGFAPIEGTRGFSSESAEAVVAEVPYRATSAPDRAVYDQNEIIRFTGTAFDAQGSTLAAVSVVLHVLNNGFDRISHAITEADGSFEAFFTPLPQESGDYAAFASHPSVVKSAVQSEFTIVGFEIRDRTSLFRLSNFKATLAQNSSIEFKINLGNIGDVKLTGLTASSASLTGEGVSLTLPSVPESLETGAEIALTLSLSALPTASSSTLSFTLTDSNGFERTLSIDVSVQPSLVIPVVEPQSFRLGVLGGEIRRQAVSITNRGFEAWRNITLTAPALPWVTIEGQTNLGNIPPGGTANFSLRIAPPINLENGTFEPNPLLQILSDENPIPIFAEIAVTSSLKASLLFNAIDADKVRDAQGKGVGVPDAAITLISLNVSGLTFRVNTDLNGIASFSDIPSGSYVWRAEKTGRQAVSGTAILEPGLVNQIEALLPTATVTYEWKVTPTTIEDRFEIKLNLVFQTDVPAPAIILDPPKISLFLQAGQEAVTQLTVKNIGFVSALNVNLFSANTDEALLIEMAQGVIPELKPNQSVTVPVRIKLLSASCHSGTIACSYEYGCAAGTDVKASGPGAGLSAGTTCGSDGGPVATGGGFFGFGAWSEFLGGSGLKDIPSAQGGGAGGCKFSGGGGGGGLKTRGFSSPSGDSLGSMMPENQSQTCGGLTAVAGTGLSAGTGDVGFTPTSLSGRSQDSLAGGGGSGPRVTSGGAGMNAGPGWTANSNPSIEKQADGNFRYQDGNGGEQLFVPKGPLDQPINGSGSAFAQPAGSGGGSLSTVGGVDGNGDPKGLKITMPDGRAMAFAPPESGGNYLASERTDSNGNTVHYERDDDGRLLKTSDDFGRSLTMNYNGGSQLASVSDHTGRETTYEYNPVTGDRTADTDPNGDRIEYMYNEAHQITEITYPNGGKKFFVYNDDGRISSTEDDLGNNKVSYLYEAVEDTATVRPGVVERVTVTDALNRPTVFEWIENSGLKKISKITNPVGKTQTFEYDDDMNMTSWTDELGRTESFHYNDKGRVTARINPGGETAQYSYEPNFSQMEAFTGPKGGAMALTYDAKGNPVEIKDALNNRVQMSYDAKGRLITSKDRDGNVTRFSYDAKGGVSSVMDPLGRTVTLTRDALSRVTSILTPDQKLTTFGFDPRGNLTQTEDPQGGVSERTYVKGREGRLLSKIVDARHFGTGIGISYTYDTLGRPTAITNAVGQTKSLTYNAVSKPSLITSRNGDSISFTYSQLDRLIGISNPDGNASFAYNAVGNLTHAENYFGAKLDISHNQTDRVERMIQTLPNKFQIALTYEADANGNRTSMGTPWGTFTYSYDAMNRVTRITNPFGQVVSFQYDTMGRRKQLVLPNNTKTNYAYDTVEQITQIVHQRMSDQTAIAFSNYAYDPLGSGNILSVTDLAGIHSFGYDGLNRLTGAVHPEAAGLAVSSETFTYDTVGNRTSDSLRTGYTYDDANRLESDSVSSYSHDANGNTTRKDQTIFLRDSSNRLIRVEASTYTIASYKYAPTGDRVERTLGTTTVRYVYDGRRVLAILDANNRLLALFTNGPGTDAPLIMRRGGNDYFYHQDALGNVNALTDDQGQVIETVQYHVYGRPVVKDALGNIHAASTVGNPFLYASRELDSETGLYYMRQRYYDPDIGRFYSEDPVEAVNLYVFGLDNPVRYTDPLGLIATDATATCSPCSPNQFAGIDFMGVDLAENAKFAATWEPWNKINPGFYAQMFWPAGKKIFGAELPPGVYDYTGRMFGHLNKDQRRKDSGAQMAARLGNFNFGLMMAAAGFDELTTLKIGGLVRDFGRDPGQGRGTKGDPFDDTSGIWPFGDIPKRSTDISVGYEYFRRCLR